MTGFEAVAPGISRLRVPIPFDLEHINVYLVDTGDGFLLVDTATATDVAFDRIERALASAGLGFRDIATIVITHFHADHAGLAGRLAALTEAPIVMTRTDAGAIDEFFGHGPPVEPEDFFRSHGAPESLSAIFPTMLPVLQALMTPFSADKIVDAGDRVASGRDVLAVLTPGHTAGHLALSIPGDGVLLGGDHVLPHITPNIGLYATSDPNPLKCYLDSLDAVARLGARRILPAHGPVIDAPAERIATLIAHHRRRIDQTLSAASSAASAWDVTRRLFGETLEPFHAWMALFESLAHLEYLVDDGVLSRVRERDRLLYGPA